MDGLNTVDVVLYEATLQVVPLLLIALFLDTRAEDDPHLSARARRWVRAQDRGFVILGTLAFVTSLGVLADVVEPTRVTRAVVIPALTLAISLLFARIWRRIEPAGTPPVHIHEGERE